MNTKRADHVFKRRRYRDALDRNLTSTCLRISIAFEDWLIRRGYKRKGQ